MDPTQITAELLEKALADPQVRGMLEELHKRSGSPTPFNELPLEKQKEMLAGLAMSMKAQAVAAGPGAYPDEVVQELFRNPDADPLLRKVMADNGLTGEPIDLPLETKQKIVDALVKAGALQIGPDQTGSGALSS